jgi:hypothetical protein
MDSVEKEAAPAAADDDVRDVDSEPPASKRTKKTTTNAETSEEAEMRELETECSSLNARLLQSEYNARLLRRLLYRMMDATGVCTDDLTDRWTREEMEAYDPDWRPEKGDRRYEHELDGLDDEEEDEEDEKEEEDDGEEKEENDGDTSDE